MSTTSTHLGDIVWQGKPWIIPAAVARTFVVFLVTIAVVWLEVATGTVNNAFLGLPLLVWTILIFIVLWLLSIVGLLVERSTNTYTLRNDSLEIRTGILTSRSYVIVPSGFSDLEVVRGVVGRIVEYGDIIIRSQSERDSEKIMIKVRDPMKVGQQIRYTMGRPIVRVDSPTAVPQSR